MPPKKEKCHRCSVAMANMESAHSTFECQPNHKMAKNIDKIWPAVQAIGAAGDNIGDLHECQALLDAFVVSTAMNNFNGREINKHMLENAFQTACKSKQPQQKKTPAKSSPSYGEKSTPSAGHSGQGNRPQALAFRPSLLTSARGTSTLAPRGSMSRGGRDFGTSPTSSSGSRFIIDEPKQSFQNRFQDSQDAAWSGCPSNLLNDNSEIRSGFSNTLPDALRVITNYVAVTNVPKVLYVYSVEYGKVRNEDDQTADASASSSTASKNAGSGDAGAPQSNLDREIKQRGEKQKVFDQLKTVYPFVGRRDWATDLDKVWSIGPLQQQGLEPVVGDVFEACQSLPYSKLSGRICILSAMTFRYLRKLEFPREPSEQTLTLLNSDNRTAKSASMHIEALNTLISQHVATLKLENDIVPIGPNKFFIKSGFDVCNRLHIHRGYFTSIRPGSQMVLLNVNTVSGAFYQPCKVSEFMNEMSRSLYSEYGLDRGTKLVKGLQVRINYRRQLHHEGYDPNDERNRHRIVADVGDIPSQQQFEKDGKPMTVSAYFKSVLNAPTAPSDDLGCLNTGLKTREKPSKSGSTGRSNPEDSPADRNKQSWIPPQYVQIDPLQPFRRQLARPHMEQMHRVSLRTPGANQMRIYKEGLPSLGLGPSSIGFPELQIDITPKLLSIPARFLGCPDIGYADINSVKTFEDAQWNLAMVKFRQIPQSMPTQGLCAFDFCSQAGQHNLRDLPRALTDKLNAHGFRLASSNLSNYAKAYGMPKHLDDAELEELLEKMCSHTGRKVAAPGLYLMILEDTDSDFYSSIKRVMDQRVGAHSACVTAAKFKDRGPTDPRSHPLLSNLAMKFNIKLRGQNHEVLSQGFPPGGVRKSAFTHLSNDTMVFGADVSHAPSRMAFCPSVAAVVGSDDKSFAQFPGSVRLQPSKKEIIDELEDMVYERILRYAVNNQQLPRRVIFFRDGVGEDQFEKVQSEEIPKITKAFNTLRDNIRNRQHNKVLGDQFRPHDSDLDLAFIVVGKRHHTRFFWSQASENRNNPTSSFKGKGKQSERRGGIGGNLCTNGNLKPGLLVDSVITRPPVDGVFDFFLQSHMALKGTAKPAHYVVLQKGRFEPEAMKHYTHHFCFNFARASRGVSYAAPAYYADRLADRGARYLKAYTANRIKPDLEMNEEELSAADQRMGSDMFATRVAAHVSNSVQWNPHEDQDDLGTKPGQKRKNPWHPNLDRCMFWL